MVITVVDIENTYQEGDMSPHNPHNRLVSVGMRVCKDNTACYTDYYWCFYHNTQAANPLAQECVQKVLDRTTTLIAHNLKHDLKWLIASGFNYSGELYDTMLTEKLLAEGQRVELSLRACAARYGIKMLPDTYHEYFGRGVATEDIPWGVLEADGVDSVNATYELARLQWSRLDDSSC